MSAFTPSATFGGTSVITFNWAPDPEEIAQELLALSNKLEDRSGPLALSAEIAMADHREHFENEEGPDGGGWAPWADSYRPIALARGQSKILQWTGALMGGATSPSAFPITADSVFFSTGEMPDYWEPLYHGTGGTQVIRAGLEYVKDVVLKGFGRGGALPPRPMIGMSTEALLQMLEVFEQWFDGAINTTFARGGRIVGAKRGPGGQFVKS